MTQQDKPALRSRLLKIRDGLPQSLKASYDRSLVSQISLSAFFRDASSLLLFHPVGSEPDLLPLFALAKAQGIPVGFPRCREGVMDFYIIPELDESFFAPGPYKNIPEPDKTCQKLVPDTRTLCVVPALSYDRERYRIGYGGGYYDRFLSEYPVRSVGVVYPELLSVSSLHILESDVPVQLLLTAEAE